MKCRMAVFEDRTWNEFPEGYGSFKGTKVTRRVPVECGGEIETVTTGVQVVGWCCIKCGVRYEKLPEEQP